MKTHGTPFRGERVARLPVRVCSAQRALGRGVGLMGQSLWRCANVLPETGDRQLGRPR